MRIQPINGVMTLYVLPIQPAQQPHAHELAEAVRDRWHDHVDIRGNCITGQLSSHWKPRPQPSAWETLWGQLQAWRALRLLKALLQKDFAMKPDS